MASTARIEELKKKFDENPRRYFAPLANEFRKAGDLEQAILICEEFLPQQPGHMSGHIVYGQALYEAGKMPESHAVFETALGLDPENLIALRHLGDIARGHSDHASARNWYVRVLDADPRNEEIQALIATLDNEFAKEEPEAAVAEFVSSDAPAGEMGLDIEKEVAPFEQEVAPFEKEILLAEEEVALVDPSLADTAPSGVPVVPSTFHTPPPAPSDDLLDGFSLQGLDGGASSFFAPAEPIESLPGLQGSGGPSHAERDDSAPRDEQPGFAPLDLDDGQALAEAIPVELPPQVIAAEAELIDADETPAPPAPPAPPEIEEEPEEPAQALAEAVPVELPPQVIAAEAELIDAGETPAPPAPPEIEEEPEEEPVARAPFVTETMAELYLAQGFPEQALSVYVQLLAASPADARLSGLVASLTPMEAVEDTGPNVRDFFSRIAARRPGTRSAAAAPPANDDFAPPEFIAAAESPPEEAPYSVLEAEAEAEADAPAESQLEAPSDAVAPAIERAAATRTPGGSLDALFGNRPPGTSEDSAAAALAQAFRGEAVVPPAIGGRPAHAASGELSLDSVFRDGPARPPRTSESFSFDQFFTGAGERSSGITPQRTSTEVAMPGEAPAEHSADDIEQFNSWLQGLKQR